MLLKVILLISEFVNLYLTSVNGEGFIRKIGYRLVNITYPFGYDNSISPSHFDGNKIIKIKFLFLPVAVTRVSEKSMSFELEFYLSVNWTDPRFQIQDLPHNFNYATYQQSAVNVIGEIWKPPLYFYNCKRCYMVHIIKLTKDTQSLFYHKEKQEFELIYRETVEFRCKMNFYTYPLDEHKCPIFVGLAIKDSRDIGKLKLYYKELDPEFFKTHLAKQMPPQFKFLSVTVERECLHIEAQRKEECIKYVIHFQRFLSFHMMSLYLPSTLIVIISILSFTMDVKAATTRILLGILSLLTLSIQYAAVLSKIPPVTYMKAIDIWMITCSTFVFLTLLEFYIARQVRRRWKFLDKSINNIKMMLQKRRISTSSARSRTISSIYTPIIHTNQVDQISKILFPFLFGIFNLIYWTYNFAARSSYAQEENNFKQIKM